MNTTVVTNNTEQSTANYLRVLNIMHWDDMEYNYHQYENGMEYLFDFTGGDEAMIDEISKHRFFWNWWKLQYNILDDLFIRKFEEANDRPQLRTEIIDAYDSIHILCGLYIDRVVFQKIHDDSARMITEVVKKKIQITKKMTDINKDLSIDYAIKIINAAGYKATLNNNDEIQKIARILYEYIENKGTAWRRLAMEMCTVLELKQDNPARGAITHLIADFINKQFSNTKL